MNKQYFIYIIKINNNIIIIIIIIINYYYQYYKMSKTRVTLSPRYQISLRSILNIKHRVVENDRLETLEEMDSYFNWCQNNKDESQIAYK